jgi:hypothetical protein
MRNRLNCKYVCVQENPAMIGSTEVQPQPNGGMRLDVFCWAVVSLLNGGLVSYVCCVLK